MIPRWLCLGVIHYLKQIRGIRVKVAIKLKMCLYSYNTELRRAKQRAAEEKRKGNRRKGYGKELNGLVQ